MFSLEVALVGICGTEFYQYRSDTRNRFVHVGHKYVARVLEVCEGVTSSIFFE